MRRWSWLVSVVVWAGCASSSVGIGSGGDAGDAVVSSRVSAARMYQTAEAMVSEGYYADAVRLMRLAILSLPRTEDTDALRHALVMRMAHVQLLAAHAEHDSAYAQDAATMLLSYGARHESLFGDTRAKQHEEIYELLFEAETFVEQLETLDAPPLEQPPRGLTSRVVAEPLDTHEGEALEAEFSRDVQVRREWFYDPDDPEVRRKLETWFSTADEYQFMTTPGVAVLSGPRPMVRRTGRLESIALQGVEAPERRAMRLAARSVLRASREGLRDCYRSAAARGGELQSDATVELTVTARGDVHDVIVVSGDVVDGLGDACVIEELARAHADAPEVAMRMRMPLLFFYDGPDTMSENERTDGARNYDGPKPVVHPGIDDFAYPASTR